MKTAFVTGATGFLGINLVQQLLADGWQVTALHRKTSDLTYLNRFDVTLVEGAITDWESLMKVMPDSPDAVFHVAANTSMWSKWNDQQFQDNVIGTRNMVEIALQKKAKRFIHTSSISAWGHHDHEMDETEQSNAINSPVNYNKTKYLAELEVDKAIANGLDAVLVNPCDIMGPYDSHNWAQVIQAVYNNDVPGIPPGNAVICHVCDIARAHISAYEKGRTGERYLLGGQDVTLKEIFNTIERFMDKKESQFVMPKWVMKAVIPFYTLQSKLNGKEPILTPEKFIELTVPKHVRSGKAISELNYSMSSLEDSIRDSYEWLKQENLLAR
ncbi:MAG: SDR family oxidoreductase [Flavobacteriales bacterium]|nr:SDR family oxidoreductase [Flavobacteriales bacterium]